MNADMLIESARTWERDWGERRTSGLITALADLAESEGRRADEAERELAELRGTHAFMRTCFADERLATMAKIVELRAKVIELGGSPHVYAAGITTNEERLATELVATRADLAALKGQQP